MSSLRAEHLRKTYGEGEAKIGAVQDISLEVQSGEVVLIMGPSGSGKTTLLLLLGSLLQPDGGRVLFNNVPIQVTPALRLEKIGFVFQHFNLLEALTAEENVAVPLWAAGWNKAKAKERARTLLEQVGLGKRAGHVPKNLSGGEKQRVAIARALANNPAVILADEPTANLDAKTGHEIVQLLSRCAKDEGKAVVIVSHDPRIRDIADRVLLVEDGKLS